MLSAQEGQLAKAAAHFGHDDRLGLYLVRATTAELAAGPAEIRLPSDTLRVLGDPSALRHRDFYRARTSAGDTVRLAFTPLPLIKLRAPVGLSTTFRRSVTLTYADDERALDLQATARYRGGFTTRYPKKSIDLEFHEDGEPGTNRDVRFGALRSDDDWILDALYNEPLRVNAYVAHKVWLDMARLPYAGEEPRARAGADGEFAELFFNGRYHGLFLLSEQVDRKQLQLKKEKEGRTRGVLFQTSQYSEQTRFTGPLAPITEDSVEHQGYELKYPHDSVGHAAWNDLRTVIDLVVSGSDADLALGAARAFDLDQLADYLLYVNALRLTDNVSKNTFLARYSANAPFFLVPWDLDASLGNGHNGKRLTSAEGWSSNGLFQRLTQVDVRGFAAKLCDRYEALRRGPLSPESLALRVEEAHQQLTTTGAYARERLVWAAKLDDSAESLAFTTDFLRRRADFVLQDVCKTSGVGEPALAGRAALGVFPNPVAVDGTVTLTGVPAGAREGVVYDLLGRPVLRFVVRGGGEQRVALRGLPGGSYVVRVGGMVGWVYIH